MSDPTSTPTSQSRSQAPGRRTARTGGGRLDVTVLLSVLLPVLAVVAALGVHAGADQTSTAAPVDTPLERATVICPSGSKGSTAQVATMTGRSGDLTTRLGAASEQQVGVQPHTPADVPGSEDPLVVTGEGPLAPGLLAGRFASPLASADCRAPASDQWFTGVGAGAKHRSVLELDNPDAGRALVDVEVFGRQGPITVPRLRGIAVAGGADVSVDLATAVPRRYDLALHVTTIRGRVTASVADSYDGLGGSGSGADWLAAQDAPSTENLLLGLPAGPGLRVLTLANPTDDQGRATVKVITPQSVFTPEGSDDVTLDPGSTKRVSLAAALHRAGTDKDERPIGIEITSTVPTTAGLLIFSQGDLERSSALSPATTDLSALLPDGDKTLELAGATAPGVAVVSMWTADGTALDDVRVALTPGRGASLDLPDDARLITVAPERSAVAAGVLARGAKGLTEVVLRTPLSTGLVPQVRPGLP